MSSTNISNIDATIQKAQIWVNDLMSELDWDNPDKAVQALKLVLHSLRDSLPIAESADLIAQMPTLIRGMYFEGWQPNATNKPDVRNIADFVRPIARHFRSDPSVDPEWTTRAVVKVIAKHVSPGEMTDVRACLPRELQDLFRSEIGI